MRMMTIDVAEFRNFGKLARAALGVLVLGACSVNPATGEKQFTALMPAGQEMQIGASEHPKIIEQYGGPFQVPTVEAYVNMIGRKVAANTERNDVDYKFYVLDTPAVNAFAMPGGYIYVTRGLLTLASSEAELAGVLAHEIGHITARHSAERYSQSMLAGLGVAILSAAVNEPGVGRAAGIGSDLVIKSYSRSQEYQADELGIRYLSRAGYDPFAMADFLGALDNNTKYEKALASKTGAAAPTFNYFATHPQTEDRVSRAAQIATTYSPSDDRGFDVYLHKVDGLTFGDSARSGFVRGETFIHPELGFTLTFPRGYDIENQPDKVMATSSSSGVGVIFDGASNRGKTDPVAYLQTWIPGDRLREVEAIDINGMPAATATLPGKINNNAAVIRVVAIAWSPSQVYRFQIAMPAGTAGEADKLKRMTYSLRPITDAERARATPHHINLVTAKAGDTAESLAANMNLSDDRDDPVARFRVLNGLTPHENISAGRIYKIIR